MPNVPAIPSPSTVRTVLARCAAGGSWTSLSRYWSVYFKLGAVRRSGSATVGKGRDLPLYRCGLVHSPKLRRKLANYRGMPPRGHQRARMRLGTVVVDRFEGKHQPRAVS